MIKFEKVKRFKDIDITMPKRSTANSAGYDICVAEDIIIPSYAFQVSSMNKISNDYEISPWEGYDLSTAAEIIKKANAKPILVPTGVKCYLDEGTYLELSVRSSTPLKYWLVLANGVGIIDCDYADNESNDGELFFQLINFSPFPIQLHKGDIIGQGIIKNYLITEDDNASGARTGGFGSTSK